MDLIRELLLKLGSSHMRMGGIVVITRDAEEVQVEGYKAIAGIWSDAKVEVA